MKESDRDRLLREMLADENVEQLRANSLTAMLQVARGRRRLRTLASVAAASVAVTLVLFALTHRSEHAIREVMPAAAPVAGRVKVITDEQLLALFPDRSVALVGRPGQQRLVFLDGPAKGRTAAESP